MEEWSILELQEKQRAGELTSRELARLYLERIELIDRAGPCLNSIIEVNPDALQTAARLDQERVEGHVRGPLHGIPIVIKDNIDTADHMMTTSGSLALEGSTAPRDAFLVERLREAGAVILAKANLSEWANFRSSHSISGWSSRGGQTRNPYALDRTPCGSSSGSAVAVAANLCAAAVGTETDGSVICPSHTNGIVGIKPTLGLISRSGIIPISHSQDTAGPMARSVADVAALLSALACSSHTGADPRDAETNAAVANGQVDYTPYLDQDGLRGARIGVARNFTGYHPKVMRLFEDTLALIKSLGAELVDPANIETESRFGPSEYEVLLYEFKADLNAYLAALGPDAPVHSMAEVIAFNADQRERAMPLFGQEEMLAAQAKGPLNEAGYLTALETCRRYARAEGIDAALKKHNLQALVAPTGDPAWLVDVVNGDRGGGGSCTSPAAVAGYPHITVPMGLVDGLPVGLSFMGPAWSEPALIRLAYAFEQCTLARRAPRYLPSIKV